MNKILIPKNPDETINRFWRKVDKTDDCWEWTAYRNPAGYGQVRVNKKAILAHRFSWALANGKIPKGMCVLHQCDNPACVNPDHLFLGTRADNSADMKNKGRSTRGERNPRSTLTKGDVDRIRDMLRCGAIQRHIADWFGVYDSAISRINTGKRWRHHATQPSKQEIFDKHRKKYRRAHADLADEAKSSKQEGQE